MYYVPGLGQDLACNGDRSMAFSMVQQVLEDLKVWPADACLRNLLPTVGALSQLPPRLPARTGAPRGEGEACHFVCTAV